ncbi:hypothetical protein STCU_10392 [Strigomonas culicis]|uniref:Uncharacterized protein n=1 Tax=Strigomonas culicis TaxID=28005 RepID=S9TLY4_9TRYP|nr:hypothetical protein STCU_10392 [Strigomonas culicis]|eukprot:EPY17814.1 hypothetical protein STCU_10392 [Strigomonas culicis]
MPIAANGDGSTDEEEEDDDDDQNNNDDNNNNNNSEGSESGSGSGSESGSESVDGDDDRGPNSTTASPHARSKVAPNDEERTKAWVHKHTQDFKWVNSPAD